MEIREVKTTLTVHDRVTDAPLSDLDVILEIEDYGEDGYQIRSIEFEDEDEEPTCIVRGEPLFETLEQLALLDRAFIESEIQMQMDGD